MYTILYVDDEQDLLDLARLYLEQSPEFCVTTRTSAQEALDSLRIATCDIIVSDYQMPGMVLEKVNFEDLNNGNRKLVLEIGATIGLLKNRG